MNRKANRTFIACVLALLMLVSTIPFASAEDITSGTTENGFDYTVSEGKVTITGYSGKAVEADIPAEINGLPVTAIGEFALDSSYFTDVFNIPASVTSIDFTSFGGNDDIKAINVSEDNPAYSSADGVLFNKDKTTLIAFPLEKTTEYVVPEGVTTIGARAFYFGEGLKSITLPSTLKSIEHNAFYWCNYLENINLPEGLETIGGYAFAQCRKIVNLDIPSTLKHLGEEAFNDCDSVTEFIVPASLELIGDLAFGYCDALEAINVSESNPNYYSNDGVLFNKAGDTLISYPAGKTNKVYSIPQGVTTIVRDAFASCYHIENVTIPDGVTKLDDDLFFYCENLTSVSIPESVTVIAGAFHSCKKLGEITLPQNLKELLSHSFSGCEALKSITLPESLEKIDNHVFAETQIESIFIPKNVTSIDLSAFEDCYTLKTIYVDEENETFVSVDGVVYDKDMIEAKFYPSAKADESYTVPDGVEEIALNFALDNPNLKTIYFPESLLDVSYSAFYMCENLKDVYFYGYETSVDDSSFKRCSDDLTFYGYTGSPAEEVALEEGYNFVSIGEIPTSAPSETETDPTFPDLPKPTVPSPSTPVAEIELGDANTDGQLNVKDATSIQKFIAGIEALSDEGMAVADYNGDTKVNVKDATAIQKFIAGII